jgi:hypothetical protein
MDQEACFPIEVMARDQPAKAGWGDDQCAFAGMVMVPDGEEYGMALQRETKIRKPAGGPGIRWVARFFQRDSGRAEIGRARAQRVSEPASWDSAD